VSGASRVQEKKLKAGSSKRSQGGSFLDQTGCFLAGGVRLYETIFSKDPQITQINTDLPLYKNTPFAQQLF
jgi:hypothetical protein